MKTTKLYDAYRLIWETMREQGYDETVNVNEQGETLVMLDHIMDVIDMVTDTMESMESVKPRVTDEVPF
jgi:hypothetical protein